MGPGGPIARKKKDETTSAQTRDVWTVKELERKKENTHGRKPEKTKSTKLIGEKGAVGG